MTAHKNRENTANLVSSDSKSRLSRVFASLWTKRETASQSSSLGSVVGKASDFDRSRTPGRWLIVDCLGIFALAVFQVIGFWPTFATFWLWITILAGTFLGVSLGWICHKHSFGLGKTVLTGVGLWFVFGGFLAMPSSCLGWIIPTKRVLVGLVTAPVTAWKELLTLDPPVGETYNLLAIPLLIGLVSGFFAILISVASRFSALAWAPGVLGIIAAWGLGTRVTLVSFPVAVVLASLILVWSSHRLVQVKGQLLRQRNRFRVAPIFSALLVLGLAAGITGATSGFISPQRPRQVARQLVENPLDVSRYGSPLQGFRANIKDYENTVLFTTSGVPAGTKIRLATLDTYDGITFNVTNATTSLSAGGQFRRVGAKISPDVTGEEIDFSIQINQLDSVWVPTVGYTTKIAFTSERKLALADSFFFNKQSGTGLTTVGLKEGDSYQVSAIIPRRPDADMFKNLTADPTLIPRDDVLPQQVKSVTRRWTSGTSSLGEAVLQIERQLHDTGYFSNGLPSQVPSLSGHTHARVADLLADPAQMVGDEEQYAVAMALIARELGVPSRVVYGYRATPSGEVRGSDVGAWPELKFNELGWVSFNPTPDHSRVLEEEPPVNPPPMRRYLENPPDKPEKPKVPSAQTDQPIEKSDYQDPPSPINWQQLITYTALIGIPLVGVVIPVVLILGLKRRRRQLRRKNQVIGNRVAGAWAELIDKSRDLAEPPSPCGTRSEQAEKMVMAFPKMIEKSDPILLARQADYAIFAPGNISAQQAETYWRDISQASQGMKASVSRAKWIRSVLSTKSFRKYR